MKGYSTSFGDVVMAALSSQLRRDHPDRANLVGRLLEDPEALSRLAAHLVGTRSPVYRVHVHTYAWSEFRAGGGARLGVQHGRSFEQFSLNYVPVRERLYGPRNVELTFVCLGTEAAAPQVELELQRRGLRAAHPIEGFELAKRFPKLLAGPAPITSIGCSFGLSAERHVPGHHRRPRFYLTLWSNGGHPTTYFEEVDRTFPAYHLFLAAYR